MLVLLRCLLLGRDCFNCAFSCFGYVFRFVDFVFGGLVDLFPM